MKRIKEENLIKVEKNDYVQLVNSGSNIQSDFDLINSLVAKSIKDVNYIILSLGYPPNGWPEDLDVFKFLTSELLMLLQLGKLIFILDGFEKLNDKDFNFDLLLRFSELKESKIIISMSSWFMTENELL